MRERMQRGNASEGQAMFSSMLMVNNIRVSLLALALGALWGIGTFVVLFYNGAILGVVICDYWLDGQARFMLGWLLPHGSVEIPAILVGGQAGLVLAHAVVGWGRRESLRRRLRAALPDVMTLAIGLALLLVWAGLVESYLSQLHEPAIPYGVKIAFGVVSLLLLAAFLGLSGRGAATLGKTPDTRGPRRRDTSEVVVG